MITFDLLAHWDILTILKTKCTVTVLLNYNFIFTCVYTRGTTRKLQCLPVTCLRGPRFLVACNAHVTCGNTCGTKFTRMEQSSHAWNKVYTRRTKNSHTYIHACRITHQILLEAHSILLVIYPTNTVCEVDFHANIY